MHLAQLFPSELSAVEKVGVSAVRTGKVVDGQNEAD